MINLTTCILVIADACTICTNVVVFDKQASRFCVCVCFFYRHINNAQLYRKQLSGLIISTQKALIRLSLYSICIRMCIEYCACFCVIILTVCSPAPHINQRIITWWGERTNTIQLCWCCKWSPRHITLFVPFAMRTLRSLCLIAISVCHMFRFISHIRRAFAMHASASARSPFVRRMFAAA